jgi:coproporphyrinogen III oxidase-like Fe-S oxidoreductase
MSKKKMVWYGILPALALVLLGVSTASAHGMGGWGMIGGTKNITPEEIAQRQTEMFQNEATLLGLSVDEVKVAWAAGKSIKQLADEKGISEDTLKQKMANAHQQQMKDHLATLVGQGVITQDQADQRLKFIETQATQMKQGGKGMGHGFGRGFGMGF